MSHTRNNAKSLKYIGEMCINARIQNFMKISTPSMAWKKRIVKNEWETLAENESFDPADMSKNKNVKIQLVFTTLLAA